MAAIEVIGVAPAQVPIPDRLHLQLPVPVLVHVVAQAVSINVLRVFDDPVLVHKGIHINVAGVAGQRVPPISPVKNGFEGVHVTRQVIVLGLGDRVGFRIQHNQLLAAAGSKSQVSRANPILGKEIAAGHCGRGIVGGCQLGNIHTIGGNSDTLDHDVESRVIGDGELAGRRVQEQFGVFAADGVMAHPGKEFFSQDIIYKGLIVVRRIEQPVVPGGQTQQGVIQPIVGLVPEFDGVRQLGETERA